MDEDLDPERDDHSADYEGWYSRLSCGACGDGFEIEDDVQNGEEVQCDACGARLLVRRIV